MRKKWLCIQISEEAISFFFLYIKGSYLKIIHTQNTPLPHHSIYANTLFNMEALSRSINDYLITAKLNKPLTILSIPYLKDNNGLDNNFKVFQSLISIKNVPIKLQTVIVQPLSSYRDSHDTSKILRSILDDTHNLISPYMQQMNRPPLPWITTSSLLLITLVFGLGVISRSTQNSIKKLEEKNIKVINQSQELQKKALVLHELTTKKNNYEKTLTSIGKRFKHQNHLAQLLETLTQTIPNNTCITQLHMKKTKPNDIDTHTTTVLTIDGISLHPDETMLFVQSLNHTPYLTDIALTQLAHVKRTKQDSVNPTYQFQIKGIILHDELKLQD